MFKKGVFWLFLLGSMASHAQEVSLPVDFRQHNLVHFNSSMFNPAFSLDRNNPESISLWTRWQWQGIDADPTTLFLNYTRKLNDHSAASVAFFQHNTGIFFNTGGVLNYAYALNFTPTVQLALGLNVFGFRQELADSRFQVNPELPIPQLQITDDFILQFAPGIRLSVENLSLSLSSENLVDYNFTDKEANTTSADKIFMGMASYDIPLSMRSDSTAYLRPALYLRTIPDLENQIGLNALFSTQRYWALMGYNNFYGISVGAGGTFFGRASLGLLVEFGTNSKLVSKETSFEVVASYYLGKPEERRKTLLPDLEEIEEDELITEEVPEESEEVSAKEERVAAREARKEAKQLASEQRALEKQARKDSITARKESEKADALAGKEAERRQEAEAKAGRLEEERKSDSIAQAMREAEILAQRQRLERQRQDSLERVEAEAQRLAERQRQDSLARAEAARALADRQRDAQRRQDSLENASREIVENDIPEETEAQAAPREGEKYEEVQNEGGLEPGYYLIANVFGTQKYYEAFMAKLRESGLRPQSFVRSTNKYQYVYLQRFDTMTEARRARDSNFDGKYRDNTWIFRVVNE